MKLTGVWALALLLALAACGGGGGGSPTMDPGDGESNPTILAGGLTFQNAGNTGTGSALGKLWVANGRLFWFAYDGALGETGGRIQSVALGGGAVTTHASGLGGVNQLAIDATHLYWTAFAIASGVGALQRVPLVGGAIETLVSGLFFPGGLATNATDVYFGDRAGDGTIFRWPKAGGMHVPFLTGALASPIAALAILLTATTLFYTQEASVHAAPLGGGGPSTLDSGFSNLFCMSGDADTLYFVSVEVPRVLYRLPMAGGTATTVENDGVTNHVSVGGFLYWARNHAQQGTQVVRQPKAGGSEEILGFGGNLGVLNALVVVGSTVYLLDIGALQTGQGRILKL